MSTHRRRLAIAISVAAIAALALQFSPLVMPMTQSVKYSLLVKVGGQPHKGDYVNVQVFHQAIAKDQAVRLTKRVGCVAGDVLRTEKGKQYCGNQFLGQALEKDSKGKKLPTFVWNGPIPEGKVYLVGDHPRSFDSRYFGFVNAAALERLHPLL